MEGLFKRLPHGDSNINHCLFASIILLGTDGFLLKTMEIFFLKLNFLKKKQEDSLFLAAEPRRKGQCY